MYHAFRKNLVEIIMSKIDKIAVNNLRIDLTSRMQKISPQRISLADLKGRIKYFREDCEAFYRENGKEKRLFLLLKNVFPKELMEKMAYQTLMPMVRSSDSNGQSLAGLQDGSPIGVFKKNQSSVSLYYYATIQRCEKDNLYVIKLHDDTRTQEMKIFSGYLGKLSTAVSLPPLQHKPKGTHLKQTEKKSNPDMRLNAANQKHIDEANYSCEHSFKQNEIVIFPLQTRLVDAFGFLPSFRHYVPARLTTNSYSNQLRLANFKASLVGVDMLDAVYAAADPVRHQAQAKHAAQGPRLLESAYTTFDVGINNATSFHRDENSEDKQQTEFYSILTKVMKAAKSNELVFPEFEVAADVDTGDVLIFDEKRYHGNPYLELLPYQTPNVRRVWGGVDTNVNPESYAMTFVLYKLDRLAHETLPENFIQREEGFQLNEHMDIALGFSKFMVADQLPELAAQQFSWFHCHQKIEVQTHLHFSFKDHMKQEDKHKFLKDLQECPEKYMTLSGQQGNSIVNFKLDTLIQSIEGKPLIVIEPLISSDREISCRVNLKFMFNEKSLSSFHRSLFALKLFGKSILEEIFIMKEQKELSKFLTTSKFYKNKKYLTQAAWFPQFMQYRQTCLDTQPDAINRDRSALDRNFEDQLLETPNDPMQIDQMINTRKRKQQSEEVEDFQRETKFILSSELRGLASQMVVEENQLSLLTALAAPLDLMKEEEIIEKGSV